MDAEFRKMLEESLFVHFPLPCDGKGSLEEVYARKEVSSSLSLWDGRDLACWSGEGEGELGLQDDCLAVHTWQRADHWPESEVRADDAAKGDYATFGNYILHLAIPRQDTSSFNRISFSIRPDCPGMHSPIVRCGFTNEGAVRIPDAYSREGFNAMNLVNGQWNEMHWEIDSIAHDRLAEVSFNFHRYGQDVSTGEDLHFLIRDIRLEQVEPEVVHGWMCKDGTAVYSTSGYLPVGAKSAIANTDETSFSIVDCKDGATVFQGGVEKVEAFGGRFGILDFTPLTRCGTYRIVLGKWSSEPFPISSDVLESTAWKLVNFLYCERCGYPVPGKHGTCHGDVMASHDGVMKAFQGGWHDAADVSQQTVQTAEVMTAMMELAKSLESGPGDRMLPLRLREEANWAMDFVLRMSFDDGWHATHAALRRWTDGLVGNMDDVRADVRNGSFELFLFAAIEAEGSSFFSSSDPALAWKCLDSARRDYSYGVARFEEIGVEEAHMREHTSNASRSQYLAAASWAAARLFALTGEDGYRKDALRYSSQLVACQEKGVKAGLTGFFYRDESHSTIVHFNHQGRDYIFAKALDECLEALPDAPEAEVWAEALRCHGDYLKGLMKYTAPYGMLPAGLHHISEVDDAITFARMHPDVSYEEERENYIQQLHSGIDLGDGYFLRAFPVWFSFRGNSAIHLSMGKAASIIGRRFHDEALLDIAREQLYWTLGKNPFGQSLIYGEGNHYGQEYTALLGETVGEMPVGVQTRGNEDLPYWPQASVATYREVWTTPPGRWMWIAADLV